MDTDLYAIVSRSERGFWNNEIGWVYRIENATVYTAAEVKEYPNLPISKGNDAEWVPVGFDE